MGNFFNSTPFCKSNKANRALSLQPAHHSHARPIASCVVYTISLFSSMMSVPLSQAAGNPNVGKEAWIRTCEHCHGSPQPRSSDAFSDYGTTANKLSVYASDPTAITKAANEGYKVPQGNTNDKVPVGNNTRDEMGAFAGMAPGRLGYGTTPTEYAVDISAYFASLYEPPTAPNIVGVATGNAQATVSFTGAMSELPISGYTVTATPGGLQTTGTASPIVVSGLTNGTAYTFKVAATSNSGTGKPSSPSIAATPTASITADTTKAATSEPPRNIVLTTPTAPAVVAAVKAPSTLNSALPSFDQNGPTILRAKAGDAQAKVYFTIPPATAANISSYTVLASSRGIATGIMATGTKSPIMVKGLTNGTEYTFTVNANGNDGRVLRSPPSDRITPLSILGD